MGGEQAANVLAQVRRDALERSDRTWSAEEEQAYKAPILEQYAVQSSAYYATARLWDDGIIDPKATRAMLALGLAIACQVPPEKTTFGVFRM
jgi:3-methylcrotonyl-CoA carboxylase beta subunit